MLTVGYLPIAIFILIALAFPFVTLTLARFLRPNRPERVKLEAYECGIESAPEVRARVSVHFYLIAVLFVVFDVEIVFLFPWAVRLRELGMFGLGEMAVFLAILIGAYLFAWRKGALEWT